MVLINFKKTIASIIFGFLCIAASFAQSEKRVALVVGNNKYDDRSFAALDNPVNDAKAMEGKLTGLGFSVSCATDVDVKSMAKKFEDFYKNAKDVDLALIYFSGHGLEVDGENYLIARDSTGSSSSELKRTAINLGDVITDATDSGCKQIIVIIDACRENSFKKTKGGSRGLSVVDTGDVGQCVTFYACGSGKTAEDGNGNHSPFTQALLNHIDEPGVTFSQIISEVTKDVKEATGGKQTPVNQNNITEQIYLNGRPGNVPVNPIYIKDTVDYSKIIKICLSLFFVLFVLIIVLFFVFTVEGKRIFGVVSKQVASKYNQGKDILSQGKDKLVEQKEKIIAQQTIIREKKEAERIEKTIADQKLMEEKQAAKEAELKDIQSRLLPSVIVNQDLYVAVSPVTNEQYKAITDRSYDQGMENYPVTDVSWFDCAQFFNNLSQKEKLEPVYDLSDKKNIKIDLTKNGWRMPTIEEWQSFAEVPENGIVLESWNAENSDGKLQPCKTKKANPYGLYDVFGLVWEFCNDVEKEKYHIAKGGAWDAGIKQCSRNSKLAVTADFCDDVIGVRGVRNR